MTAAVATPPPATAKARATLADLLALPDDGTERWLLHGEIVEVGMTIRNRTHARVETRVGQAIANWIDAQPAPRGAVFSGEAGVRLCDDPEVVVGVDVVYLAPEVAATALADATTTIIAAVPTLAVEILSPSDTVEHLQTKIDTYRDAGVALVWVLDPHFRTVTVYRPTGEPVMLNASQELDGGTDLPGFRVPVARLFDA
jgi:Uma2 family endonuclease